jgi:hypothetical protein
VSAARARPIERAGRACTSTSTCCSRARPAGVWARGRRSIGRPAYVPAPDLGQPAGADRQRARAALPADGACGARAFKARAAGDGLTGQGAEGWFGGCAAAFCLGKPGPAGDGDVVPLVGPWSRGPTVTVRDPSTGLAGRYCCCCSVRARQLLRRRFRRSIRIYPPVHPHLRAYVYVRRGVFRAY